MPEWTDLAKQEMNYESRLSSGPALHSRKSREMLSVNPEAVCSGCPKAAPRRVRGIMSLRPK